MNSFILIRNKNIEREMEKIYYYNKDKNINII